MKKGGRAWRAWRLLRVVGIWTLIRTAPSLLRRYARERGWITMGRSPDGRPIILYCPGCGAETRKKNVARDHECPPGSGRGARRRIMRATQKRGTVRV